MGWRSEVLSWLSVRATLGIGTSTPSRLLEVNGPIGVIDGGNKTYNGGLASEVGASLLDIGMNEDGVNRFGGTYISASQGGMMRECRAGLHLSFNGWEDQQEVLRVFPLS